jgi:uncharacterized protein YjeT (DUF2065 family)
VRRGTPPQAFEAILEGLKPLLLAADWSKLMAGLKRGPRLAA